MLRKKLVEFIENLDDNDIIGLNNEICSENGYYEDMIEYMGSFSELFYGVTIEEFIRNYDITSFNFNDNYFKVLDNYDIISFDYIDGEYDVDIIADDIEENWKYYKETHWSQDVREFIEENIEEFEALDEE